MILEWILDGIIGLATVVVGLFPDADLGPLLAFIEPANRLICWLLQLNEAFPVAEALIGFGLYLGVVGALSVVMLARRAFSMLWPGAGS